MTQTEFEALKLQAETFAEEEARRDFMFSAAKRSREVEMDAIREVLLNYARTGAARTMDWLRRHGKI